MEATERFAELVADGGFPLDEAALLVAAHARPGLDVTAWLDRLDDLAADVPDATVDALCRTLFGVVGLAGDQVDYYDPENSYLDRVLERRRGIPISLCIVTIEVGRRAGVPLVPIGTPAHFLARTLDGPPTWVDCFAGGVLLDRAGLDDLFARLAPGVDLEPFLDPLAPADVLRRVLGNLVAVHRRRGDRDALRWASELRTLLPGATVDDLRTHAGALAASGAFARAAEVLDRVAEAPGIDDPEAERARARRLRARLN